jgi:lipoprotein-anchoring transpeptidase ErfK/SrfK
MRAGNASFAMGRRLLCRAANSLKIRDGLAASGGSVLRRSELCFIAALAMALAATAARAEDALSYLEGLKGSDPQYRAPSELDPRFTIALYVNTATSGPARQRMWVLQRDAIGGAWRLAMWDEAHWRKAALGEGAVPAYSWPVSTGRYYRGDRFSGPTPTGVFALDERKWRYGRGFTAPGMIHTMYIDFHYEDGRRSGVAFHGTTNGRYRRLGTNDSHGCIRMKKTNALAVLDRITGRDEALSEDMRWGEVPRFWRFESGQKRWGYTRDGTPHGLEEATNEGAGPSGSDTAIPSAVLTKTGFRAIAVIFDDPDA